MPLFITKSMESLQSPTITQQTRHLLFDFGDHLVILNVDGSVVYARGSGHAGQLPFPTNCPTCPNSEFYLLV